MAIADKLLEVNQVKQDIKEALETQGVDMTGVPFTEYADKVLEISGGGGMTYEDYARTLYSVWGKSSQFETAWQKQIDAKNVIYDINVTLVASNQNMGGMYLDLYIGDSDLTQLYNDCVNEVIPLPSSGNLGDIYLINNVAVKYYGDVSSVVGFPIPLFQFGALNGVNGFIIADLTPLGMGLGITLAKITSVTIPNNKLTIQQGFDFEEPSGIILPDSVISIDIDAFYEWQVNNQPLVIPNSVTSIGGFAFTYWDANNKPLVIPNSVTSIGNYTFAGWKANNHPLIIPDSVTSIGEGTFQSWNSNNHPLIIPDSITSIGEFAFADWVIVPYIELISSVPPTLVDSNAFSNQNNAPIYVPHASVNTYKTASEWSNLAARIFSINDKP
jgi:hypothetical protein